MDLKVAVITLNTVDDARLTIEVMKRAEENGAEILNHTKSTDFIYDSKSKVRGIEVQDLLTGEMYEINAKKLLMQQALG